MRGPYKTQAFDILKARGIPINTVLDVGILTGTPELIKAFPDKPHVLFEPIREYEPEVDKNYADVDHEVHWVAVADVSGVIDMRVESSVGTDWITHSYICEDPADANRQVPVVTLDQVIAAGDYVGPFLLKIDVDGVELRILQGASGTLKKCSVVMVEADKSHLAERIAFLQARGFELFDIIEPAYYDDSFWQCDLVFVRADLHAKHFKQLQDGLEIDRYTIFTE